MQFFKKPISSREAYITELIEEIKAEGGTAICVYAKSVCAYVDFDKLSKENNISIVTLILTLQYKLKPAPIRRKLSKISVCSNYCPLQRKADRIV